MPTVKIDENTEIFVHNDAVAGAIVTLLVEIIDPNALRAKAEQAYLAMEAGSEFPPDEAMIDDALGTPDSPDIEGCLRFLLPHGLPGGDILDVVVRIGRP